MSKDLIIVESPAKTRTLKKFLGSRYLIEASMGHIRDLVKKDLGIGPDYEPNYEILKNKREVVDRLRKAAKKADLIYLAPDPDREGEAIAWHVAEVLKREPESIRRITFNEITKRAVEQALDSPREIDHKRVDAQQARRILDRLMGFRLSPLLWDKVKRGLSAGRVQSVALKMVCDKQAEIDAFISEEYWNLSADLEGDAPPIFNAKLHQIEGKKAKVVNGEQAGEIVSSLESGAFKIDKIERKESKQRPSPPFITSRLQQEAARRFGYSVKRTMTVAQGLYEGREIGSHGQIGLITYMRTDSTRVSQDAIEGGRAAIAEIYGPDALPAKPNIYRSKKNAQDAHEAIRPANFELTPEVVTPYLKPEEAKLYKLIWDRFIASQMLPAIFDVTRVDIATGKYTLRAEGKILKSPGFLAVYREVEGEEGDDDQPANKSGGEGATLPELKEGESLKLKKVHSEQKFTQPPAQFSEATLVRALEKNGIGRPSTYAAILSTLTDRDYVEKVDRRFRPTLLGSLVNRLLQDSFNKIINEGYTASLEETLDKIADGDLEWKKALAEFDTRFTADLEVAGKEMPNVKREGIPTDEVCPDCGSPLVLRFGRYGSFYGCTNYPDCSYTRNPEEAAGEEEDDVPEEDIPPCEKCGAPMAKRRSRYGTFYGCTAFPECKNIRKTEKEAKASAPKPTGVACPECGKGEIHQKKSRRGKIFYSCDQYPTCKFALWKRPIAKACPDCGAPFLLEKVTKRKGTELICNSDDCNFSESITEEAAEAFRQQAADAEDKEGSTETAPS